MILYLHGFRSSPRSVKAVAIEQALQEAGWAEHFLAPQLPVSPRQASHAILDAVSDLPADESLTIIGSSLGGYYATWLGETHLQARVLLLNPAVRPQRDLSRYLGPQTVYYSDAVVHVLPEYLEELDALWVPSISAKERYLLVAATGDEVLDYREMVERYHGCPQLIIEGSDHALSDFEPVWAKVSSFVMGR